MSLITPEYTGNMSISAGGVQLPLAVVRQTPQIRPGEGDLPILTFRWELSAALPDGFEAGRIRFTNGNNSDRVGWNEIVVKPISGISIFDSTAFGNTITDELRVFPVDRTSSPLAERTIEFSFTEGKLPRGTKPLRDRDGSVAEPAPRDRLAELIKTPEITPAIAFFALLVAFGLGAMHAMSPGHGKAVVGAYLVGSKGTPKHAAFLGLTVTITHTLGVFALGLLTLFASKFILPERLMPVLSFVSGLLVLYIGLMMFKTRLFAAWAMAQMEHRHSHDHSLEVHSHGEFTHRHDGHTHAHLQPDDLSWKNLIALGISGGLLPCPSGSGFDAVGDKSRTCRLWTDPHGRL